jgi:hypothetical protein
MLLSNLLRADNPHVEKLSKMPGLTPIEQQMWKIHTREGIDKNQPVVGERACRYIDRLFEQADKDCDLHPNELAPTRVGA